MRRIVETIILTFVVAGVLAVTAMVLHAVLTFLNLSTVI